LRIAKTAQHGVFAEFDLSLISSPGEDRMAERHLDWIYGRHPVLEMLAAHRRKIFRVLVAKGVQQKGSMATLLRRASAAGVRVEFVPRSKLDEVEENHQGVLAEVSSYPYTGLADILDSSSASGEPALILLLDMIQNPQNLGTLLRSAEAIGVHGVILPYRRSVGITPAVVRASAGASEHLLIAQDNLARTIEILKVKGIWIGGLAIGPEARGLNDVDLSGPLGLVVGSEGEGMRRLVRESCDFLIRLPMRGRIESLNAAVAGSIALYAAGQARGIS
jgi:23S rRNA (guanosine2251-2'-O)-methyltransferase